MVARRYRNRRIGEFLKELKMTEGRCTGIPKTHAAMKRNGSPKPKFTTDELRTWFLVELPVHREFAGGATAQVTAQVTAHVTTHVTMHVGSNSEPSGDQVGTKLATSRHQVAILEKCREETGITALMELAQRKDRTKFRQQVLSPLLAAGLIEMTIPDKPRSSKQQYWLTPAGRAVLGTRNNESQASKPK